MTTPQENPATAAARAELALKTQATAKPLLTTDELNQLLTICSITDSNGNLPSSTDWAPTYDTNTGAVQGWLIKAAKVAGKVDLKGGDSSITQSQMYQQCKDMAEYYRTKAPGGGSGSGSVSTINVAADPAYFYGYGPTWVGNIEPWWGF